MKKIIATSILAASLIGCSYADTQVVTFSAQQKEDIGKIAAEYLVNHPDFLIKASHKLQAQQQEAQKSALLNSVLTPENVNALVADKTTPTVGMEKSPVTVVMFFDYNCAYCSLVAPALEKVMADSPNTRFVFKDLPIFSRRWASSNYAALVGIGAFKQGGGELYIKYHNAIFSTGKDEGKLKKNDVESVAKKLGIKLPNADEVTAYNGMKDAPAKLAKSIGFGGTPAFVVMPTDFYGKSQDYLSAHKDKVTVFAGFPSDTPITSKAGATGQAVSALIRAIQKAT